MDFRTENDLRRDYEVMKGDTSEAAFTTAIDKRKISNGGTIRATFDLYRAKLCASTPKCRVHVLPVSS